MQSSGDEVTIAGGGRRQDLILIAYRHIVERGFEGLRVRQVAAEAGINNATLHYYFPTKEALIQGVVQHLMQEFQTARVERSDQENPGALEALRYEFEDLNYRLREMPEMFTALIELSIRARRDPAITRILRGMDSGWRDYLVSLLERGKREGVLRADLDLTATTSAIMTQLKAVGYKVMEQAEPQEIESLVWQLHAQIEYWITKPDM